MKVSEENRRYDRGERIRGLINVRLDSQGCDRGESIGGLIKVGEENQGYDRGDLTPR